MKTLVIAVLLMGWGRGLPAQEQLFPSPQITEIGDAAGFDDDPTMVRAADGSFYVAWISFRGGADSLQLARYSRKQENFTKLGQWQVAAGKGTNILGPRLVTAPDGAYLLYASEQYGNWEVLATRCTASGPGKALNVSRSPAADTKPDGVWSDGALWVAWESNRDGAHQVLLAALRNDAATAAEAVSAQGKSNYGPSIAAQAGGRISVAWHSFRAHNYDVYLRQRQPRGDWSEERRVTQAPTIDRHAVLVPDGDDLWLLYENAAMDGYHIGRTTGRKLVMARLDARGWMTPAAAAAFSQAGEAAAAAFAGKRAWVAYLAPKLPRAGWELMFTGFTGDTWLRPHRLSLRKGMDRRPALALDGNFAVMAYQTDNLPETWAISDPSLTANASSRVVLAALDLRNTPPASARMDLKPLEESNAPFEAGGLRVAYGEDRETPAINYQGKTLKLFYGDLHAHSDISVCVRCGDQSLDENYQHRRDINRMDFVAMTDHDYNFVPYLWAYAAKLVRANEDPGRLLTFLAEEWTSSFERYSPEHPYGYYGHRNLVFSDTFFPKWFDSSNGESPAQLWAKLRGMKADFVNIPHQLADTGNVPTDWNYTDEQAQPVAEIFQNRGSYEYKGTPREAPRSTPAPGYFLQDAWAKGKVIGVIASPDHGGGLGKACVYAPDLSRTGILAAIRQRHTFGTTAARMFMDVRVNGLLMGEKGAAPAGKPVEVRIRLRCPAAIDRVEVCRNNRFIYTNQPPGNQADLTFVDTAPLSERSYYYVRVVQKDKEIGWSSPVWLGE